METPEPTIREVPPEEWGDLFRKFPLPFSAESLALSAELERFTEVQLPGILLIQEDE